MFRIILSAVLSTAPVLAHAADASGTATGMSGNEMIQISESHMLIKTAGAYENFDVPEDHPLAGASGPCFGATEVKNGEVSGGGVCAFDTASGEKAVLTWKAMALAADGALTGEWSVSGGSGAWAKATGGGSFSSLTDPETGKFANTISGEINME